MDDPAAATPRRVRLSRRRGWRLPAGCLKVDRSTRWGNPWRIDPAAAGAGDPMAVPTAAEAVARFEALLAASPERVQAIRDTLRGHDLACWCRADAPCHADVLLRVANA